MSPPPFNEVSAHRATFEFELRPDKVMLKKRVLDTRTYGAAFALPLLVRLSNAVGVL